MPMPENTLPENLDAVLGKYGKIWIWSILSAVSVRLLSTAGILTFQGFASPISGNRNSPWSPLLMLVTFLPSLGRVASVWFLLQFLRHHILPILFPPPTPATARTEAFTLIGAPAGAESAPPPSSPSVPDGGNLLYAAFASIVVALALEAFEALFSIVYRAVVV